MPFFVKSMIAVTLFASVTTHASSIVYSAHKCDSPTKAYRTDGTVVNPSSSTTWTYWCDVPNHGALYNVYLKVQDSHPTKSVSCSLYTHAADGSSSVLQNQQSIGAGTGKYTLTYSNIQNFADASYSIACVLPETYGGQESKIINYKVQQ
ncbi:hypothetical protein [Rheinheimera sp. SA_1]|uniref:hypothetical protein n=1 Tax=Rheinheimera sp. SA_1 TaxID=1827365 RepID=UPI000A638DF3|nr:hypothetical protein [Rheinheimera sp. SA_1]